MNDTLSKFRDPKIIEAIEQHGDTLSGMKNRLTIVSDDIRNIETYFQNCGLFFNFDHNDFRWGQYKCGKQTKRRLQYRIGTQDQERYLPLLETKVDVRLKAIELLPEFVKLMSEQAVRTMNDIENVA